MLLFVDSFPALLEVLSVAMIPALLVLVNWCQLPMMLELMSVEVRLLKCFQLSMATLVIVAMFVVLPMESSVVMHQMLIHLVEFVDIIVDDRELDAYNTQMVDHY